jgi:hypothetical protein
MLTEDLGRGGGGAGKVIRYLNGESPRVRNEASFRLIFSSAKSFSSARFARQLNCKYSIATMADQVSVAENIERVSTAGFELAQQLHCVSASGREIQEEINSFRSQLQSLDVLLATSFDESSDL